MESLRERVQRGFLRDGLQDIREALALRAWEKSGRNGPPPLRFKQRMILEAAAAVGARVLVETGTGWGDMARAMAPRFREVYTMEADDGRYERARRKFDPQPHLHCLGGSSPELLTSILRRISEPCVFWLCSHTSAPAAGAFPAFRVDQELRVIGAHRVKNHAILIDAAAMFTGGGGPPSLEEIDRLRAALFPALRMTVEHGLLRLMPG